MTKDIRITLVDGYIDDPAALGVPPYISPMIRAIAGASVDAGATVEYVSIDMIRNGRKIPGADVSVVLSGNTVPGKYIRSMPMSTKELISITPKLKGWKLIGGSAASSPAAEGFDFSIKTDLAASLYDGIIGKEVGERYRTLDEWNRWMVLGADLVSQHQDFPHPLVAEIETYRGCHRYKNGGCSYCIEPLKGKPLMRSPKDIIAEAERLVSVGVRNVRIGGQTCIISYGSTDDSDIPTPNPHAIQELFTALNALDLNVLHVDNANPAVIASHPDESRKVIGTLVECCTSGNVLALGLESADPIVFRENNLNCTSEQLIESVRIINELGRERGPTGLPKLLPGINIICGLDGETAGTYAMDLNLLKKILEEDLLIRRINIRQVMPLRRDFHTKVDKNSFKKFKEAVREEIDREMLRRVIPEGNVLKDVYMEIHDGNTTFGRQVGTYPVLVGIPYKVELGSSHDVVIIDWGFRSVTGITTPFNINTMPMSAIEGLPGIGKKRAARIVVGRPYHSMDELEEAIGDPIVSESLGRVIEISFKYTC
ncbi:tRNA-2-methylthio-N(6)-dimethylallyladenosine synthase [Candidatus Methanoplasma termitum]|uniref:MiaB2 protein n=1 Tax=Candidatus Methanoplasma termitum TaxID=1577791 RepID=A0A0A7LD93_9ARCH|nr:radical SAM protein [Candidatus Methanoplasma termitum]AIZ57039.1 tRNA-2-methylthio-N(6)-dimethylallyladenosine synthase [Candidatus Methanoplasma termitum]MCL2334007.1 radical SAM protein [Candidatus Methanoplasma sp.]